MRETVMTLKQLTNFLRDIDGQNTSSENLDIYEKIGDLIDIEDYRNATYDYDRLYNLADTILSEYGERVDMQPVKKLTHKEIVGLLGFEFEEVG